MAKRLTDEEILQILDDSDSGNLSELMSDTESSDESGPEEDDGLPEEEDNRCEIIGFFLLSFPQNEKKMY
jgi:hypothetical protein